MKEKLLVFLDALLDTRIACVSQVNQAWAKQLVCKEYTNRISDEFQYICEDIDIEKYREAYRKRNVETLMVSIPTHFSFILDGVISVAELEQAKNNPDFEDVELEVNYYPYTDLTSEELEELAVAISARAGINVAPKMVCIPFSNLTLERIESEKWTTIIMYDFDEWWTTISQKFDKDAKSIKGVPQVNLMVPALLKSIEEAKDVSKRTLPDKKVLDPFETTQFYFSEIISLTFISPEAYSFVFEENNDEPVTTNR